ncbi:metallophosphoesterase family protein (plasmid) [Clostridium perfringens]
MSSYVISDLHGCFEKFSKMLSTINFTDRDTLYILGDIIDRGPDSLKIIDFIVCKKNIVWIKGNHEELFEDYCETGDGSLWFYNGGKSTFEEISKRGLDFQNCLYEYIRKLPLYKVVDKFILVHGGLYLPKNYLSMHINYILQEQDSSFVLWDRSGVHDERVLDNYTIICGHTPVQTITNDYKNPPAILHRNGRIFIDCGCCFKNSNGLLACLRLDDMMEFYV